MKTYKHTDSPIEVHGLPFFYENGILERVPAEVREKLPSLAFLGRRCAGARLCFRTNAPRFKVKLTLETLSVDVGMSLFSSQGAHVMIGDRKNADYAGLVFMPNYETKSAEKEFKKPEVVEDVTVYLPRNEVVAGIEITIDDGYELYPPTPYRYPQMLFYGSSITEGGCASVPMNAYSALLSNHLDVDYINYGFSGNAKGELVMADLINTIPMSIFVLDYDHNAPTPEHLAATHEPFFKRIREKNPELPIVMMTKPDFDYADRAAERREIIRTTYLNALAAGDNNVYFLDGETFFGNTDRPLCTLDRCHPNDLGFYRMATVIEPVIADILKKRYPMA